MWLGANVGQVFDGLTQAQRDRAAIEFREEQSRKAGKRWGAEEEAELRELVEEHHPTGSNVDWRQIAELLGTGRSASGVEQHWAKLNCLTDEEHLRFLQGLELFGKNWSKVADVVGSRTTFQVELYALRYLAEVEEEASSDDDVALEDLCAVREARDRAARERARQDLRRLARAARGTTAPAPRLLAAPAQRAPVVMRQRAYAPPPADASPAVTFNDRGEPRWASGNHVQDANDATVRGIIINNRAGHWKDVATTTGTVEALRSVTQTTLTDEEVARCVIPASETEYWQARIDGKIRVDIVGQTFQNRYTAADGTERRQLEVTGTIVRCALCPDARTRGRGLRRMALLASFRRASWTTAVSTQQREATAQHERIASASRPRRDWRLN